jgi:hypothetical protein
VLTGRRDEAVADPDWDERLAAERFVLCDLAARPGSRAVDVRARGSTFRPRRLGESNPRMGNVRLAHKLCNRVDYQWRQRITPMLAGGKSLEEIAAPLNADNVRPVHGEPLDGRRMPKGFVS